VLQAVAVLTLVGCAGSYSSERSSILAENTLNNAGALGAPQQSVAAEWAIRDLAALIVKQNTDQAYLMYALVALLGLSFLANLVVAGRLNRVTGELTQLREIFTAASAPPPQDGPTDQPTGHPMGG
jgi:predicted permease